jgi:uncharacterized membrane protein
MVTIDNFVYALTLLGALGSGLIAGVFFAFSAFIMKAFARLSPGEGIAAMQSVNIAVINPAFLSVFLGTAVVCALLLVSSFWRWPDKSAIYSIVGGALYLVGTIAVTFVFNIPRNNALAAAKSSDPESATLWAVYLKEWTFWNHLRTAAAFTASLFLIIGLCQ